MKQNGTMLFASALLFITACAHPSKPVATAPVVKADSLSGSEVADTNAVYTFVEEMPAFPGGDDALNKYIYKNLHYKSTGPEEYPHSLFVTFIIEKDGHLSNITLKDYKKGDPEDEAFLKIIRNMPRWKPGSQGGKNVRVQFTLPVRF